MRQEYAQALVCSWITDKCQSCNQGRWKRKTIFVKRWQELCWNVRQIFIISFCFRWQHLQPNRNIFVIVPDFHHRRGCSSCFRLGHQESWTLLNFRDISSTSSSQVTLPKERLPTMSKSFVSNRKAFSSTDNIKLSHRLMNELDVLHPLLLVLCTWDG